VGAVIRNAVFGSQVDLSTLLSYEAVLGFIEFISKMAQDGRTHAMAGTTEWA